jgi:SpoVK/Ycf46/Vps4 family AAA+-type ATPase
MQVQVADPQLVLDAAKQKSKNSKKQFVVDERRKKHGQTIHQNRTRTVLSSDTFRRNSLAARAPGRSEKKGDRQKESRCHGKKDFTDF